MCKYLYVDNNTGEYINLSYSCSHNWQLMPWKCNDMFFVYVVWLFSAKVFISNASWVKFPSKYQLRSDSEGLFPCSFGGIARWENTWEIPQKYQLNSEVRPFPLLFWLEFHQNTTKSPSKYHPNSRKCHKNSIKIPQKFHKNSRFFCWKMSGISSE